MQNLTNLKPKETKKYLQLQKYLDILKKCSPILQIMSTLVLQRLFLCRFWSCYAYYHYSLLVCSVSVNKKQQKMALAPEILTITTIFSPILQRMNILVPQSLLFFYGWILVNPCLLPFLVTHIQCIDEYKIAEKWLQLQKYSESPQFFSRLVKDGHLVPILPLILLFG